MSRPTIIAMVLTIAIIAVLGATVINANTPRSITARSASSSIDVMQMMKDAKNLPEERYDAH